MLKTDGSCFRQRAFAFPVLFPAAFARAPQRLRFPLDPWRRPHSRHPWRYKRTVLSTDPAFAQILRCSCGHLVNKVALLNSETCERPAQRPRRPVFRIEVQLVLCHFTITTASALVRWKWILDCRHRKMSKTMIAKPATV